MAAVAVEGGQGNRWVGGSQWQVMGGQQLAAEGRDAGRQEFWQHGLEAGRQELFAWPAHPLFKVRRRCLDSELCDLHPSFLAG